MRQAVPAGTSLRAAAPPDSGFLSVKPIRFNFYFVLQQIKAERRSEQNTTQTVSD